MEHTITRRTRCLGISSTIQPTQTRHGLEVQAPVAPDTTGLTARGVLDCLAVEGRRYGGADWAAAIFVGRRRIVDAPGFPIVGGIRMALRSLVNGLGDQIIVVTED